MSFSFVEVSVSVMSTALILNPFKVLESGNIRE